MPTVSRAAYSAAKAAVNNLTVSLSKEVGRDGVTVNTISPGTILTPKAERVFRELARQRGCGRRRQGRMARCREGDRGERRPKLPRPYRPG